MKKLQVRKKKSRATIGGTSHSAFAEREMTASSKKPPEKNERVSKQSRDGLDSIQHGFTFICPHKCQEEGETHQQCNSNPVLDGPRQELFWTSKASIDYR